MLKSGKTLKNKTKSYFFMPDPQYGLKGICLKLTAPELRVNPIGGPYMDFNKLFLFDEYVLLIQSFFRKFKNSKYYLGYYFPTLVILI